MTSRPEAVLLYSGGTDSTCAAALLAERGAKVHLLTFVETGTSDSPVPKSNVERLRARYGADRFEHVVLPIDKLLERVSYERYGSYLRRHGLFMLATPGFSTLSWHARAIAYCLDHGIGLVADGLTRELMHFPGHMDAVVAQLRELHRRFGIDYENPVRDWPVPPDRQFLDQLIVDRHGFPAPGAAAAAPEKTTGRWLFERGLLPRPDVKGSKLDFSMQHGCYPFVVYNVFAFWLYLSFHDYAGFEARLAALFGEKIADVARLLEDYRQRRADSPLGELLRA